MRNLIIGRINQLANNELIQLKLGPLDHLTDEQLLDTYSIVRETVHSHAKRAQDCLLGEYGINKETLAKLIKTGDHKYEVRLDTNIPDINNIPNIKDGDRTTLQIATKLLNL